MRPYGMVGNFWFGPSSLSGMRPWTSLLLLPLVACRTGPSLVEHPTPAPATSVIPGAEEWTPMPPGEDPKPQPQTAQPPSKSFVSNQPIARPVPGLSLKDRGFHPVMEKQKRRGPTTGGPVLWMRGEMPPGEVLRGVWRKFGGFRMCYEDGLRRNPSLSGRVTLELAITPEGEVRRAGYASTDLPLDVTECMARFATGLLFPSDHSRKTAVDVLVPLVFAPGI